MTSTRVAIVTGAASFGIGRSIALRLAADGLDVAVNDLPSRKEQLDELVKEIQGKGRLSVAVCGDVSEEADVKILVTKVVEELGGLDVMIANVGVAGHCSLLDMTVEEWDRIMRINARGMMLQYKYAAEQLVKQGRGGRIIGACSIAGKKGLINEAHYSASKFAVRGLTQAAASELGKHKITVNAYAPGVIKTEMSADLVGLEDPIPAIKEATGLSGDIKIGNPEVIASLVSYLVKPESHFITGQTVNVDGGLVFD